MQGTRAGLPRIQWLGTTKEVARQDDGNTVVEMSIGISLFLMVLIGIIEVGLAMYTYNYVCDAAREGSRWAMVRGAACSANTPGLDHCNASQTDIQSYLQGLPYPGINSSSLTVTASWLTASKPPASWSTCTSSSTVTCKIPGNEVQVTVSYPFPLHIPFWQNASVTVASTSSMVISQ